MLLNEITKPIKPHLDEFNKYFKKLMSSDVTILNLILKYLNLRKGKQLRPVLVFLSAEICGGINQRSYTGAGLVEILHTATLIHDDVVDEAKERRGLASINSEWNNKIAVLVGDYLLSLGLIIASEQNEFSFLNATSDAVKRMSKGELRSIEASRVINISEEKYFKIIADKTASLISACCKIGALSSTDNSDYIQALEEYGEFLGTAFQIRDDVFDYISRSSFIGKPVGNDIKEKKITLPLLYALSKVSDKESSKIVKIIKKGNLTKKELNEIIDFAAKNGGIDYSEQKAEVLMKQAIEKLSIFPESDAKTSLLNLSEFVVKRNL